MKRSGKSWGINCLLQVKMEWVTGNLHDLIRMNAAVYSCRLQGFPTVPQFAVYRSYVVRLYTGINVDKWQPKYHVCQIYTGHSLTERTSGEVCIKKSGGSYMKQTLKIKSYCMVSMTIPSVSNGSGPSNWDRVWVRAQMLANRRSGLSIHLKRQFGSGSMLISQPVWLGRVVSGSPSGSVCRFI